MKGNYIISHIIFTLLLAFSVCFPIGDMQWLPESPEVAAALGSLLLRNCTGFVNLILC